MDPYELGIGMAEMGIGSVIEMGSQRSGWRDVNRNGDPLKAGDRG